MAIAKSILNTQPPEPPIQALVDMYKAAALELHQRAMQRLVKDNRMLTMEARRARVLLAEVEAILQELDVRTAEWIAENIPKTYRTGIRQANIGLTEIGIKGAVSVSPAIHQEALNVLVGDMQDDLLDATEWIVKGFRRMLRRTQLAAAQDKLITGEIAKGVIAGKARREVTKAIYTNLIDEYAGGFITINGRNYDVGKYAELVAHTKTREAMTAGTINRILESGEDLAMVTAHGAKDGCGYYEGRIVSLTGASDKYPPLASLPNGGPPFHPNCKHSLVPFVEELASDTEIRRGVGIPASVLGKDYASVEKIARAA